MAELPKKTGLDVTFQFLNTITGNAETVFKQRQAELQAYDSEVKQEQAVLNTAQSSIDNAKMSRFITLDMQDNPDKFADMDDDQFSEYIESIPGQAGVDMAQYSDPLSKINFIAGLKETENKLLEKIQVLRTNKATNNLANDTMTVLAGKSPAPDPVVPGQFIQYSDEEQIDALDALYQKGKLTGANIKDGLNDILVNYAKEKASQTGYSGVVKYVIDRKLTGKDFAALDTIRTGVNTYNDAQINVGFHDFATDALMGKNKKNPLQTYNKYMSFYNSTDKEAKQDEQTKTLGNMAVRMAKNGLGLDAIKQSPEWFAFETQDGPSKYPNIIDQLEATHTKKVEDDNLLWIAQGLIANPQNGVIINAYNDVSTSDKRKIDAWVDEAYTSDAQNTVATAANDPSIVDFNIELSPTMQKLQGQRVQYAKNTGRIMESDQNTLWNLNNALSDSEFTPSGEMQQNITEALQLANLYRTQGVDLGTVFGGDQLQVLNRALDIMQYTGGSPEYVLDKAHEIVDMVNTGTLKARINPKDFEETGWFGEKGPLSKWNDVANTNLVANLYQTKFAEFRTYMNIDNAKEATEDWINDHTIQQGDNNGNEFVYLIPVENVASDLTPEKVTELYRKEYVHDDDIKSELKKAGRKPKDVNVMLFNVPGQQDKTKVVVFDKKTGLAIPELGMTFLNKDVFNNGAYIEALSVAETIRKGEQKQKREQDRVGGGRPDTTSPKPEIEGTDLGEVTETVIQETGEFFDPAIQDIKKVPDVVEKVIPDWFKPNPDKVRDTRRRGR